MAYDDQQSRLYDFNKCNVSLKWFWIARGYWISLLMISKIKEMKSEFRESRGSLFDS